jgi:serine/threonine protein kinase
MVLHMLQGLRHIGKKHVLVRNIKPDNVLVEHVVGLGSSKRERFIPRFSDFGLSVDVSAGGQNLRRPVDGTQGAELVGQLVGWWYDTQKVGYDFIILSTLLVNGRASQATLTATLCPYA